MQTLQTNQSNRQGNQKFPSQRARPKEFLRGSKRSSRETGEKIEIIITITEAELIIDKPFATVERDCQHQEARTEAEIGAEQSRTAFSFEREKCCRCGPRNHASKEYKNCFE